MSYTIYIYKLKKSLFYENIFIFTGIFSFWRHPCFLDKVLSLLLRQMYFLLEPSLFHSSTSIIHQVFHTESDFRNRISWLENDPWESQNPSAYKHICSIQTSLGLNICRFEWLAVDWTRTRTREAEWLGLKTSSWWWAQNSSP